MTSRTGSSPRVRGTRQRGGSRPVRRRFIPACAGNAPPIGSTNSQAAVHPRVCGERCRPSLVVALQCGSSPRVRGTHKPHRRRGFQKRFIPACAGNALGFWVSRRRCTVHPRVCGERDREGTHLGGGGGSSPRVRGTPKRPFLVAPWWRFIPACAGNAASAAARRVACTVHPRVCGERPRFPIWDDVRTGSSPRVRGTPATGRRRRCCCRFIPACAGNAGSAPISP